jgi:hypothetical protein
MPRHAPEFQARARSAGIHLVAEVARPWLTPRGHLDADVHGCLGDDARITLDRILVALDGDADSLAAKRRGSMRVDFMTESGLIVEYDEVQHFTSSRRLTLDRYPGDAPLGFDPVDYARLIERWLPTGDRAFAHKSAAEFPGAAGRQRQRAYFDAFRDLAAPAFEVGPLIRIPCPDDNYAAGVRRLRAALGAEGMRPGRP